MQVGLGQTREGGAIETADVSRVPENEMTGKARWYPVAVLAMAAVLFLARLGARALWSSEGRWAEIVREMRLSSNYFWPTINGRLYYDKPLLSYWFIVAAARLTSGINETAARLPSAIAGLAGVGLLILLARRLYGRTTAALAGFILATSFSYVFFSRHASADVETVTGVLAALTLFVWRRERPDGWWVVGMWLIMAVTSLTKGLLGFVLPLLTIGAYSLITPASDSVQAGVPQHTCQWRAGTPAPLIKWLRNRMRWFFNLKTPIALIAAAIVYCLPFLISQHRSHSGAGLYMVFRENVVRFVNPFDHRDPPYIYLYVIFALMAPWSIFLPAALLQAHRRLRTAARQATADADLFPLVYFWATLAFFTLSRSRRSYYLLPILPAAALLVARLFSERADDLWAPARRAMRIGYGLLIAAVVVLGIAFMLPPWARPGSLRLLPRSPAPVIFGMLWTACVGDIIYARRNFSPRRLAVSCGIIAYLALFFLFVVAMPLAERYRYEKTFAQAVRANVDGAQDRLALFRIWGPGLVYYLSMPAPIAQFDDLARLAEFVESKGAAWVITRQLDLQKLNLPTEVVTAEPVQAWQTPSETRGRYVLVKIRNFTSPSVGLPAHQVRVSR